MKLSYGFVCDMFVFWCALMAAVLAYVFGVLLLDLWFVLPVYVLEHTVRISSHLPFLGFVTGYSFVLWVVSYIYRNYEEEVQE